MRIHDRQKLVDKGVLKQEKAAPKAEVPNSEVAPKTVESFDALADILYKEIVQADGYDQKQLFQTLKQQGWQFDDLQIAINILYRRNKIVYVGE